MKYIFSTLVFACVLLAACSAPEEIKTEQPPIAKKDSIITPPPATRVYTYNERYFIPNASIDDATNIDDPLQAIRVIQLKKGTNKVLVISSFDKLGENSLETWFGIEMPSFAPGSYRISDAAQLAFYRFYLGEQRKRIDGKKYDGKLTIEQYKDGYISGHIDAKISGETKSFDEESKPVTVTFTGSFRIQEVALENTLMKTR